MGVHGERRVLELQEPLYPVTRVPSSSFHKLFNDGIDVIKERAIFTKARMNKPLELVNRCRIHVLKAVQAMFMPRCPEALHE